MMKKLKKYINTLFSMGLIVIFFLSNSCSGILEKDPIATLDAGSFFQTANDAEQALNAAYNPLLFNNENSNFYWAFATLTSDEAITAGDGARAGLVEMGALTYTPRTEELNTFWAVQYKGINQANLVLGNIETINIDQEINDRITGEALFLRSYYYFLLAQVFGDVPLYIGIVPPDELKIAKTSRSAVFEQIINDCELAAKLLPPEHTANNIGRATKGAALALAAKANLYSRNWEEVISLVNEIKGLGIYDLMEDYSDNFKIETQNNKESVWEIQHKNLELGVGNFLNQWWASRKIEGYGFAEVKAEYADSFEPDDPRKSFTLASKDEDYFGVAYKNSFSSTGHSPRKFLQPDSTVSQKSDGDINYTAIRYAEVLLWEAEALIELNRLAEAEIPLEKIRARARAQAENPSTALPIITSSDQQQMKDALIHERKVELGFELHRFFDLIRWGIAKDVLQDFEDGKHEFFPLPQNELDLNPQLIQNPGY